MKENLLNIISHYGIDKQLKYIHSEYFELDEAIIKAEKFEPQTFIELNVNTSVYISHIAEEIADVMVMLKQFQYYYKIEDKTIEDIMKQKIERQLERIDKE